MALARLGRVLYVAGSFSGVNGKPMSNLARHTFSKVLFIVTLYVTCTRAQAFEKASHVTALTLENLGDSFVGGVWHEVGGGVAGTLSQK